jgi:hypothetical protein
MRNHLKFVEVLEKLFDEAMSKRNGGIIVTRFGGQEELRNTLIGKDGFQSFEKYFAWIYGILTDRYYALMEQYIYLTEEEIENMVLDEVKTWYVEEA